MPGRYIAFEGVEGCGKSTHVKRLAAHLDALVTREPGGTVIGTTLREIMANTANTHLSARAEALLMAADRAQHLHELVVPTLESGRHVVSDRSVYSSLAYQGYGRQLDLSQLRQFNDFAINSRWPDLWCISALILRRCVLACKSVTPTDLSAKTTPSFVV